MLIIGHRGAKGLAPENTKAAFEAGLKNSVDYIEFDVRSSSDGKLVINHDPTLKGLPITKSPYKELKNAYAELLTFEETMKLIAGRRPVFAEIKRGADIATVIKAFKAEELQKGSLIGSFDYSILKALRQAFPEAELVVIHKWSGVIASWRARRLETKYIAMNQRWLWGGFIRSMSNNGYKLLSYTINSPTQARRWQKSGLYAVVTDYPDRFRA